MTNIPAPDPLTDHMLRTVAQYEELIKIIEDHFDGTSRAYRDGKCRIFTQKEPPQNLTKKWWGICAQSLPHGQSGAALVIGDSPSEVRENFRSGIVHCVLECGYEVPEESIVDTYVSNGGCLCAVYGEPDDKKYAYYFLFRTDMFVPLSLVQSVRRQVDE